MPALYRKYRSGSFAEVVGQPQVTDILEASLRLGKTTHGYLFIGPRGVGKTSVARILAYAINDLRYTIEENNIDIIEIDAASNTGVDNIRDLINKAQIAPAKAKKKVYIIDEVHMLSKSAFNALLKLLEEPPKHVVFILATTDEYKIPATIVSRMQKFIFRRIPTATIVDHLAQIATKENIKIDNDSLNIIAESSNGGMRDAISLFDQLSNLTGIKRQIDSDTIREVLGLISADHLELVFKAYESNDIEAILNSLKLLKESNYDPTDIASQLASYLKTKVSKQPSLINLIERLLLVSKSSDPELGLLVALGKDIPATIQASPVKSIVQPITKPIAPPTPTTKKSAILESKLVPKPKAEPEIQEPDSVVSEPTPEYKSQTDVDLIKFDSEVLLKECQTNFVSLYSMLNKANFKTDGNKLIIAAPNKFTKKRLDMVKYKSEISQALTKIGYSELDISTIIDPETVTSNANIKAAIEVMGGGEQVVINE